MTASIINTNPTPLKGYAKSITILDSGRALVENYLRENLSIPAETSLDKLVGIKESDDSNLLKGKDYDFDEASNELIVDRQKGILNKLRAEIESAESIWKESEHFISKDTNYNRDLSTEENHTLDILRNTSNILDRAFNRRTTLSSWLLYGHLKTLGLKDDDFDKIKKKVQEVDFVKRFHEYLSIKLKQPEKAIKLFNPDEQKLVKLYSTVSGFYNKLDLNFVKYFPIAFTIQNISMPWIAKIFSGGILNKLAHTMMILNPWMNEFTENLGNYFIEIKDLQNGFKKVLPDKKQDLNGEEKVELEVDNSIKLSRFTNKENSLNNIVSKINEGTGRLFGKGNTVSSMCLNLALRFIFKQNYDTFASQFVDNEDYIKKLANSLEEGHQNSNKSPSEEVFKKYSVQDYAAKVITQGVRLIKSMPRETITKITNRFGATYATLNPLMPLLAHVFQKGPISWVVHTLRDIAPLISDLFVDHLANFRKEIFDIKTETEKENIQGLFPDLIKDVKSSVGSVIDNSRSLWVTVSEFAKKFKFRTA